MPFCVACGAEHPAGARFCPSCGRPITGAPHAGAAPRAKTRKIVTVLFADIVGSTSLGEHNDPETVQAVLGEYFANASSIVGRHGGTIEKFIGDAVVAVFGIPDAHEDDALRAVRAAVELRSAMGGLHLRGPGGQEALQIRIGVTTGEVVVGDPTTGQTFSVGDAMNTAARLQTSAGAGEILIGDLTHQLVRDAVEVTSAGDLALKGKDEAVAAWRVTSLTNRPAGRRPRPDAPLVGRAVEVARLGEVLQAAQDSATCRLVTLLGDAGVGKTKLAEDFVDSAGVTLLHGRCLSYGEGVTFWPLLEVLRGAVGADDATPDDLEPRLRAVLHRDDAADQIVERLLGIVQGAGTANAQELFWAVRRFLEAIADSSRVVLLVDDIHWAEPTFLDLLEYLAAWTRAPLLLLTTARTELLGVRPEWGTGEGTENLELPPLSPEDAAALVQQLLSGTNIGAAAIRRVAQASEGNPLYVEEMLRMLADDAGGLAAGDERWRVPPTVHALIAARLDQLDDQARALLQRAAVVGAEFSLSALSGLADELSLDAGNAAATALQTLVHREFVVAQPHAGEGAYRFGHGLVRDVAYAGTPKRDRAVLHARLAAWLAGSAAAEGVEHIEIVGHHLGQAATLRTELGLVDDETRDLAARACELLALAGRRALARSDMPAATKLLRRAATLAPAGSADQAQLQLELCDGLIEMGELDAAAAVLANITAIAAATADDRLRARATVMQATLDMNLDIDVDRDTAVGVFDELVAILSAAGDFVGCAQALQVLADVHWNDSSFEAAQKDLESALAYAQRAADPRERGRIVAWLASALLWGPAPADEAVARCRQMIDESPGDLLVEGKTSLILAGLYAYQGRFDEARATFERSREIVEDLGLSLTLASGTQVSGMIEMLAGDPAAAEAEFRRGYDALVAMGQKGYLPAAAAFLAGALLELQRFDEAASLAAELARSAAADDEGAQGDHARLAARLAIASGDHDVAVEWATAAVGAYAGTDELRSHADALSDLAAALAAAGRTAEAREAAESARRLYALKGVVPSVAVIDRLIASLPTASDHAGT